MKNSRIVSRDNSGRPNLVRCCSCKQPKTLSEFFNNSRVAHGCSSRCKSCDNIYYNIRKTDPDKSYNTPSIIQNNNDDISITINISPDSVIGHQLPSFLIPLWNETVNQVHIDLYNSIRECWSNNIDKLESYK